MSTEITVPTIGESVSSGILASWLKKDGEYVNEGDEIFELETDKASLAVPSPGSGVLRIGVEEGEEVSVGQSVGAIEEGAAPEPEAKAETGGKTAAAAGTGAVKESVSDGSAAKPSGAEPAAGESAGADTEHGRREGAASEDVLSPAVRRILSEHGLSPSEVSGTGKGGRITAEDAQKAVERMRAGERSARGGGEGVSSERTQRREKMTAIRKRIAENLVRSKLSAAHLTTFNEVDMTEVMSLRSAFKDEFEKSHGTRLGFMSFFLKASVRALREYPQVNAFIDGEDVLYNDYYDIGVALSSDRGLITPVVRDADRKSFAAIEAEIVSFAERAKSKKLTPDELMGATFTITNGGVFGSMLSTPIPSPPQSAILGMHAIQKRPVAIDDQVVIRPMMYVALTYDHRLIDGREAIGFLMTIKRCIEDPRRLLLDI